jgi:hypothetical protein
VRLTALTVADLTLFFLGVVVSLAAALVWVFWEIGNGSVIAKAIAPSKPHRA